MSNRSKARAIFDINLSNKENVENIVNQLGIKKATASVYVSAFKKDAGAVKAVDKIKKGLEDAIESIPAVVEKEVSNRRRTAQHMPERKFSLDEFWDGLSPEEKEEWPTEIQDLADYYHQNPVFGGHKRSKVGAE